MQNSLFTPPPRGFFSPLPGARFCEGKKRREGREKEMEVTGDGSVEPDPREWSSEKVATFVRALGAATLCCTTVTLHPPPSQSIIYYGTGSLMFTPPPRHPIFTHFHDDFLMTLFFHPPPPDTPFSHSARSSCTFRSVKLSILYGISRCSITHNVGMV
jgi:hypothetical protein